MIKTKLKSFIHTAPDIILDLLAPRKCAGCKKEKEILCKECVDSSFKFGASCVFCNFKNNTGRICAQCRKTNNPNFERVLWTGEYKNALKNSIWELKYKQRKELAAPLAALLYKKFLEFYPKYKKENFFATPIPMHSNKKFERKYNQSEILAKEFSKLSGISFSNAIIKIVDTKAQVENKTKSERIKNLKNAFDKNYAAIQPPNSSVIILIDDVTTTGATFLHASYALRKVEGRAPKIICLAIAHGYGNVF